MAVNWKRLLTWIIALVFFIAILYAVIRAFSGPPPITELMLSTMTLRTTNDTVQRSALITDMNDMVKELDSDAISAQWATLTDCIAGNLCTQDDYFDFLLMITVEKHDDIPNADTIISAITANRYWGNSAKIIEFSKALSDTNDAVEATDFKTITNKWQEIIQCDGKCGQFHQLFFEFVRLLIAV